MTANDLGMLAEAVLMFKRSLAMQGANLEPILRGLCFDLITCELAMLSLIWVFRVDMGEWFSGLVQFLIATGLMMWMVAYGSWYVEQVFLGVSLISPLLDGPPFDPSATGAWGLKAAQPIAASLANQGFLSFASNPITTLIGLGAWLSIVLAFMILAFWMVGLLLTSFLLSAATPFYVAFGLLSHTRGLMVSWVKWVLGCMSGMFMVSLLGAGVQELGPMLTERLQVALADPHSAQGWETYGVIFFVGCILCGVFAFLPMQFIHSVGGVMAQWGGVVVARAVGGGMAYVGSAAQSMAPGGGGGGGGGGQSAPSQVSAPPPGAPMGAPQQQEASAWGRRP